MDRLLKIRTYGLRANSAPATRCGMPRRSSYSSSMRRTAPHAATENRAPIQRRLTIHMGMPSASRRAKNVPIGNR